MYKFSKEMSENFWLIDPSVRVENEEEASNLSLKYGNIKYFEQYNFEYLLHPVVYKFKHCVGLKRMKHNFKILGIHHEDAAVMTKIIRRMHAGMRLRKNAMYVTHRDERIEYADGETCLPASLESKEFFIEIEIDGFKTNEKGFPTPQWAMSRAVINK